MGRELKIGSVSCQEFRNKLAECRQEVQAGAVLLVEANGRPAFGVVPLEAFDCLCSLAALSPSQFADVLKACTEETAPHLLRILAWVSHKGERK